MRTHFGYSLVLVLVLICALHADVILTADGNSGRDNCWVKRYAAGVNSWGIDGTGSSLNGNIWWNSFPGENGTYQVKLGAVLEPDGNSPYKFYIAGTEKKSGNYPYSTGTLDCGSGYLELADIDLGEHQVGKGDQIKYWAQSVYPCGSSHGQYSRFYQIKFIPVSVTPDETPPSVPSNIHSAGATNTTITVAWNASADAESGVSGYRVYVANVLAAEPSGTSVTLTGLTKNTQYAVSVSAVNGRQLESAKSAAVTLSTANEAAPANTIFVKAIDGALSNGMAQENGLDGAIAGAAIYGTTGNTSAPSAGLSMAIYQIEIPVAGTWYAWGRFKFSGDAANSFWLQVDGGTAFRFGNGPTYNAWHWDGNTGEIINLGTLSAGSHTITVYSREPAADCYLDVICLTPSAAYTPDDADVDFTAVTIEKIRVLAPDGGETFSVGDAMIIEWESDARFVADVNVYFSPDGGDGWAILNSTSSVTIDNAQWGAFEWAIPASVLVNGVPAETASNNCLVKVAKYGDHADDEEDVSDAVFSIAPSSVYLETVQQAGTRGQFRILGNSRGLVVTCDNRPVRRAVLSDIRGKVLARKQADGSRGIIFNRETFAPGIMLLNVLLDDGVSAVIPVVSR